MIRSIRLATAAFGLIPLAGCGGDPAATSRNEAALPDNQATIEDVPADSLAAPEGMPEDSESNGSGSASGGNAT